jgi:hypothetical protein
MESDALQPRRRFKSIGQHFFQSSQDRTRRSWNIQNITGCFVFQLNNLFFPLLIPLLPSIHHGTAQHAVANRLLLISYFVVP